MKLRISSTTIDDFAKVGTCFGFSENPYTLEDFVKRVKAPYASTPAMDFGSAFGMVITEPDKYRLETGDYSVTLRKDAAQPERDFVLLSEQAERGIEAMRDYPAAIWEEKATLNWQSGGYDVEIVCKADGLCGNVIIENKTTGNYDHQSYVDSLQWRFYLLAFAGFERVEYNVFEFSKANVRKINDVYRFSMHHYAGMESEMQGYVDSLVDVIKSYKLELYFHEDWRMRPNR